MSIPIIFIRELHNFCVRFDIDEMTFSLKEDKDTQNPVYQYINLDDMECQFGKEGDVPTNFIFE